MSVTDYTIKEIIFSGWFDAPTYTSTPHHKPFDLLEPLRHWIDKIEVSDRTLAHRLCKLIPTQCPFARQIKIFGHTLFTIPPLCKLNPLYNEIMALRFRAICYLADQCGEDVSAYC